MSIVQSVAMPKLGLTMTEGTLSEWKVASGDSVSVGDVLFVVETDKISNEIEAQHDGIITALHAQPGDVLPVGALVASLTVKGAHANGDIPVPAPLASIGETHDRGDTASVSQPSESVPDHHSHTRTDKTHDKQAGRHPATPLARRLARQSGVDLTSVKGSGIRGRIVADDIRALSKSLENIGHPPLTDTKIRSTHGLTTYQQVVARRLTESKRDIPHFYVFAQADVTDLLKLREQLNRGGEQVKLTISHFLIAAVARAMAKIPAMNRLWATDQLCDLATIDIGLAIESPKGLVAPVLHDTGLLTLDEVAKAADLLISRARGGQLAPKDLEGGAISISNVGMFGASALLPIINPGQSSILGVGASQAVFRPDSAGQPVLRHELELALSCDHRVIDGALAARFLQVVCHELQTAANLLRRPSQDHRQ